MPQPTMDGMDVARSGNPAAMGDMLHTAMTHPRKAKCQLNDGWGVTIQVTMLVMSVIAMIIKRRWATNPRPLTIWFFDCSKQGFAACVNHIANVVMSEYLGVKDLTESAEAKRDKCSWYFVVFIVDCVIGTYIIVHLQDMLGTLVERNRWTSLVSGEYGDPPRWSTYWKQLVVFFCMTVCAKIFVAAFTMMPFMQFVGNVMWLTLEFVSFNSTQLKAFMSLFVIPLVFNIAIFWIIDGVLMRKSSKLIE